MFGPRLLGLYYALDLLAFFALPILAWNGLLSAGIFVVQCILIILLSKKKLKSKLVIPIMTLIATVALFYMLSAGFTIITTSSFIPPVVFLLINLVLMLDPKKD